MSVLIETGYVQVILKAEGRDATPLFYIRMLRSEVSANIKQACCRQVIKQFSEKQRRLLEEQSKTK